MISLAQSNPIHPSLKPPFLPLFIFLPLFKILKARKGKVVPRYQSISTIPWLKYEERDSHCEIAISKGSFLLSSAICPGLEQELNGLVLIACSC
jgi:hypothetical protein